MATGKKAASKFNVTTINCLPCTLSSSCLVVVVVVVVGAVAAVVVVPTEIAKLEHPFPVGATLSSEQALSEAKIPEAKCSATHKHTRTCRTTTWRGDRTEREKKRPLKMETNEVKCVSLRKLSPKSIVRDGIHQSEARHVNADRR